MTDKDNTVDLFTKRKLSSIESEKNDIKQREIEHFKQSVQNILDQYKEMLDNNTLKAVTISGVTESGIVTPRAVYFDVASLHKLQFSLGESCLDLHEYIADCYGLREIEYLDDD